MGGIGFALIIFFGVLSTFYRPFLVVTFGVS
jgi:hypothetical protein